MMHITIVRSLISFRKLWSKVRKELPTLLSKLLRN